MTCVSMGNPHVVMYCRHVAAVPLEWLGPHFERLPIFPNRINVHFVQVHRRAKSTMRTWERGSGITLACGTGACAVCVAGVLTGRTGRQLLAHLPGGDLELDWAADNHVYMTGPAVEVFSGEWERNGRTSSMKLDSPFLNKLGGLLGSAAVRWWMGTLDYKVAYYDRTIDPIFPECRGQKIYIFWHEYILFPLYLRGHCNLAMLLSRHRDAEVLSHAAHHLGFEFVRGSTNRGGVAALRQLLARSRQMHLTITPDGPRGPRRRLAPGCVYLASKLGLPLVVMGYGYDRPWRVAAPGTTLPSRARTRGPGDPQRRNLRPARPGPPRPGAFPPEDRAPPESPDRRGRVLGRLRRAEAGPAKLGRRAVPLRPSKCAP